jgi:hypothetical protein
VSGNAKVAPPPGKMLPKQQAPVTVQASSPSESAQKTRVAIPYTEILSSNIRRKSKT